MEAEAALKPGVYRIFWRDGGSSVGVIGMTYSGLNWMACSNWTARDEKHPKTTTDLADVERVELIATNEMRNRIQDKTCSICGAAVPVKSRGHGG